MMASIITAQSYYQSKRYNNNEKNEDNREKKKRMDNVGKINNIIFLIINNFTFR